MIEFQLHLGQQTRAFKLRGQDVLVAESRLGKSLLEAFVGVRSLLTLATVAAAAYRHHDSKCGPNTIVGWLDAEPAKRAELDDGITALVEAHLVAGGQLKEGDLTGKAPAAPTSPSSAG